VVPVAMSIDLKKRRWLQAQTARNDVN